MIAIVGGGGIATKGIIPIVGGHSVHVDVTDYVQVDRVLSKLQPETVVVTAGISQPATTLASEPSEWRRELEVNLLGSYHVAHAALNAGTRTLIFLASVAGLYGKPNHGGYSASKAGVISLVRSLGMEGVDAYAISPGRVDTTMREKDYPGEDPRTRLHPEQVGQVVADILAGHFQPGDNIIIRKIGYDTCMRVDQGAPWRRWLKVGEPVVV